MNSLPLWFWFVLFAAWGIGSLASAWARRKRFQQYQRDVWLLTDALEKLLMSIAFILGSLTIAPHPIANFQWLLIYSRCSWLLAFLPFAVGIFLDWHSLATIELEQNKS